MSNGINSLEQFLRLSADLTGFSKAQLQGTGMLEMYYGAIGKIIDSGIIGTMLLTYQQLVEECDGKSDEVCIKLAEDPMLEPVIKNVATLWYLGQWNQMPREWRNQYGASALDRDHVISAEAYRQGLAWVAMGAHPMGTKEQGYGAWSLPPAPPP